VTWIVRKLGIPEYAIYQTWFNDAELSRRISITPQWFDYVTQTPGESAWMIFRDKTPVAVIQFGEQPRPAMSLAVNPLLRSQGWCVQVIWLALEQPELQRFDAIYGYIEPDNVPSLRCVERAGFVRTSDEPDEDGLFEVVFNRASVDLPGPLD
jgi:RimJ/RimL family protein N-acetyltransferase